MASSWMLEKVQGTVATPKPAVNTPVVRSVAQPKFDLGGSSAPASAKSNLPIKSTAIDPKNPHGKLFSGGLVSKGIDVLRLPEYAAASFNKGVNDVRQKERVASGIPQDATAFETGFQTNPQKLLDRAKAGVKNIIPGVQNRTQLGREEGDFNAGALYTKNPTAQSGINLAGSLASPALPVAKVGQVVSKVASQVPKIPKVSGLLDKGGKLVSRGVEAAKTNPAIYSKVEQVPGLEHFRNPEAGKILTGATDVATRRISGLYNQINDMAKGLTPAERVKVGQIIQGGLSNNPKLVTRAKEINRISDDIGQEVVDAGLMSPESFAKFKGKYLSHIADTVKQDEIKAISKTKSPLSFSSSSLKQNKGILGSGGQPDYIRQFQFPSFKALSGEIQNVESVKAIKELAKKFGSEVQTTPTNLSKELVNTLLKEKRPIPKQGLGEIPFEQTAAYKENVGSQLTDLLKSKVPATSVTKLGKEEIRLGTRLGYRGQGGLSTKLGGIGELPTRKTTPNLLKTESPLQKSFVGPRTTADGRVLLEDLVPDKIARQVKGLTVPKEVGDYITRKYANSTPDLLGDIAEKATNIWKLGKTVYSGPAYHIRNLLSNQILSDFSTGAGLPKTILGYKEAVSAYLGKGSPKMQKYLQELKDYGAIGRINIAQGVENLRPDVFSQGSRLKAILNSPKKFQTASEETAKLNVYSFWRNKGKTVEEAAKKAEEAIFSPYNINASERGLLKGAVPFYSFTRQAVPLTLKTGVNKGNTLTKYEKGKTAVEGLSPEGSGEQSPNNQEGLVRLPIKDKNGQFIYADPTYILPHGNFDSTSGQLPFGLGLNPIISEPFQQIFNKDTYFNTPIAKSGETPDRANAQRGQHAFRTFLPNLFPTDIVGGIPTGQAGLKLKTAGGSKLYDAFKEKPDYAGRTRSKVQAVLDTFGLKTSSASPDQPKFDASAKRKAIQEAQSRRRTLLNDKRLSPEEKKEIMEEFSNYIRELQSQ